MDLDKFVKSIEIEIHGTHAISTESILKIYDLVKHASPDTETLPKSYVPILSPFDTVLIKTINHMIKHEIHVDIRKKLLKRITTIGFKLFPNHITIYLVYALVEFKQNQQSYIDELMKPDIDDIDNKRMNITKIIMYIGILIVIIGSCVLVHNIIDAPNQPKNPNIYNIPF